MDRDQASNFIHELLKLLVSRNGSDLFITADFPPAIKVDGKINKVSSQALTAAHTLALTRSMGTGFQPVKVPTMLAWLLLCSCCRRYVSRIATVLS